MWPQQNLSNVVETCTKHKYVTIVWRVKAEILKVALLGFKSSTLLRNVDRLKKRKGKGKGPLMTCLCRKKRERERYLLQFRNLAQTRRWVVAATLRPLYPQISSSTHCLRGLGGPRGWSEQYGKFRCHRDWRMVSSKHRVPVQNKWVNV